MNSNFISITYGLSAIFLAIVLLIGSAIMGNLYKLPLINSWALIHGTVFLIFPLLVLLSFLLFRPIANRIRTQEVTTVTSVKKRASLLAVLSILSPIIGFGIPFLGPAIGIVSGHVARSRCKSNANIYGSEIAFFGLVFGYIGLTYTIYVIGF